jgi:hypothetical protein
MRQQDLDMELQMIAQLKEKIKRHDFSHMMSDDSRVYMAGNVNERNINNLIHPLCVIHRIDAEELMREILNDNPQQFIDTNVDGDDLTHRVIKGWFKPYVDMDHIVNDYDTSTQGIEKPFDKQPDDYTV